MKPEIFRKKTYIPFTSVLLTLITIVIFLLFLISSLDGVYANGRVTDWKNVESDSFQVSLGTIPSDPRIGVVHISIRVKELTSGEFIDNAEISVVATGPSGSSFVEETFFENDPIDSTYFDGLINVDKEGPWDILVTITMNQYSEAVVFRLNVVKTHPLTGAITLVAVIGFLIVLGFSARRIFVEQKKIKKGKRFNLSYSKYSDD